MNVSEDYTPILPITPASASSGPPDWGAPVATSVAAEHEHPAARFLREDLAILNSKCHDYNARPESDPYENFRIVALYASARTGKQLTVSDVLEVFVGMKIARLMALGNRRTPNHEKVADTMSDLRNYIAMAQDVATRASASAPPEGGSLCRRPSFP